MIFLLICGAFSGFCFVVGCTASVIKAVRDRKRILKKRSERGQVEERDNELIDSQSENLHKSLTKGGSKTTECRRQDFNNTERQRKPGISGIPVNEKLEIDYGSVETSFHSYSHNVGNFETQTSDIEKSYGAHSQSTNLVLNDEILTDEEKDNEDFEIDSKGEDDKEFCRKVIQQNNNGSSGTFLVDTDTPIERTKSYQAAMVTNVFLESSLTNTDVDWSSKENILKTCC